MNKCCKRVKASSITGAVLIVVAAALLLVMAFALPYFKGIFTGLCEAFVEQITNLTKIVSIPVLCQVSAAEVFLALAIAWLVVIIVKKRPSGLLQVLGVLIVGFLTTVSAFLFANYTKDGVTYNYFFGAFGNSNHLVELILMIAYMVVVLALIVNTIVLFVFVCKCRCNKKTCECSCEHEENNSAETPAVEVPTAEPVIQEASVAASSSEAVVESSVVETKEPEPIKEPEPVVQQEIAPDSKPVIIKPDTEEKKVSLSSPDKEAREKARVKATAQAEATRKIEQARLEKLKKEQAEKKAAEAKKAADKAKKEKEKIAAAKAKQAAEKAKKEKAKQEAAKAKKAAAKKTTKKASTSEDNDLPKVYHVSQHKDGRWQVKAAKSEKALKLFNTQAEAIAYAKEVSKNQSASIRVHSLSGKIRKA